MSVNKYQSCSVQLVSLFSVFFFLFLQFHINEIPDCRESAVETNQELRSVIPNLFLRRKSSTVLRSVVYVKQMAFVFPVCISCQVCTQQKRSVIFFLRRQGIEHRRLSKKRWSAALVVFYLFIFCSSLSLFTHPAKRESEAELKQKVGLEKGNFRTAEMSYKYSNKSFERVKLYHKSRLLLT